MSVLKQKINIQGQFSRSNPENRVVLPSGKQQGEGCIP